MTGPSLLICGDSKAGKSLSTIIGLVKAGFEVFVADFDCAAMYCLPFLSDEEKKRLHIKTLKDHFKWKNGEIVVGEMVGGSFKKIPKTVKIPTVVGSPCFNEFLDLMTDWNGFGSPFNWGPERVVVIDSGTEMGECIIRKYMKEVGKEGLPLRISDWSMPQAAEVAVISDLVGAGCSFAALYHLKHIRPPTLIDDDIDVIVSIQEETKGKKKGGEMIDSTFTRTLWPTGIGEKNAKTGVIKQFSIYVQVYRDGDGAKLQVKANEDSPFAVPLPDAKKRELEKMTAEKAIPQLFMEFGAQPRLT